jgi:hypothetical protein
VKSAVLVYFIFQKTLSRQDIRYPALPDILYPVFGLAGYLPGRISKQISNRWIPTFRKYFAMLLVPNIAKNQMQHMDARAV